MTKSSAPSLTEKEQSFKDMFPDVWMCPYCMSDLQQCVSIPRDDILGHVNREHCDYALAKVTWESLYRRLAVVGGL